MFLAPNAGFKSLFTILAAYWDTGKADDWKLDDLIGQLVPDQRPLCIEVHAELTNEKNVRIAMGRTERSRSGEGGFYVNGATIYPSFILNGYTTGNRKQMLENTAWPVRWRRWDCLGLLEVKTLIFTVDANTISENMSVRLAGIQYTTDMFQRGYSAVITTGCISSGLSMGQYFNNDTNFSKIIRPYYDSYYGYRFR
jgi:hypothetical protein